MVSYRIRSTAGGNTMKKNFLLGTVGLVALGIAAPALAADLPAKPITKAPPPPPQIYDWTGFYIGGNGGWANQRRCFNAFDFTGVDLGSEGCHDANGAIAGGQIGYRWQTGGGWIWGLEALGDWAELRGRNQSLLFTGFENRSRVDAFGLFTGQVGYAWNNVLFYVKGGAAVVDERHDILFDGVVVARTDSDARWGATVGAGFEYGFAPGWSVGVEYDHIFLDRRNRDFITPGGVVFATDRISGDVDMVMARVNYRFGWGAGGWGGAGWGGGGYGGGGLGGPVVPPRY
jgi:outer membrane immunogenic protein